MVAGCSRQKPLEQAVVTGPSMGSSFPGEHRKATCPNCNYPIICDAARGPNSGKAFCPMCGGMELDWRSMPQFPGAHCEIETGGRKPERWDVVAIELPTSEHGQRFGIKRVIGLPGERLSLRDGNLIINGSIVRKTIREQRLLWQPVFDAKYVSDNSTVLIRFVPGANDKVVGNGSWRSSGSQLVFVADPDSKEWRELVYRHRPAFPLAVPVDTESNCLIRDHYSYNQGVSSTMLPVTDLAVEMFVDGEAGSELELVFNIRNWFQVTVGLRMESDNKISLSAGDLASERISVSSPGKKLPVLVSVIDRCCVVQISDRTVFELPYSKFLNGEDLKTGEPPIPLPQLVIRARGKPVEIDDLRIWRDTMLVWADPFDGPFDAGREVSIPAGNYFLIGDNLPISRDSRNWANVFVPEANLLGLVKKPD